MRTITGTNVADALRAVVDGEVDEAGVDRRGMDEVPVLGQKVLYVVFRQIKGNESGVQDQDGSGA